METYASVFHPGTAGLGLAIARAQAQPVAVAFVGVMVVVVGAVLQGAEVGYLVLWMAPLAYLGAASWGLYDLHRKPAEIVLRSGFGAIRSVWDVARQREDPTPFSIRLEPVFEPGRKEGVRYAAIGDRILPLRPSEWPEFERLLQSLRASAAELERGVTG